jgi:hypothetical protein
VRWQANRHSCFVMCVAGSQNFMQSASVSPPPPGLDSLPGDSASEPCLALPPPEAAGGSVCGDSGETCCCCGAGWVAAAAGGRFPGDVCCDGLVAPPAPAALEEPAGMDVPGSGGAGEPELDGVAAVDPVWGEG